MKIIQIIQKPQMRGAEIFSAQLSEHLNKLDHQVIIVAVFPGIAKLPFRGRIIQMNRKQALRFCDVAGWYSFAQLVNEFKPDIIQANAADTLKFTIFSKLIFRWHQPVIYRNANLISGFINSRIKLWFNKFLLSQTAGVISVSEICNVDCIRLFKYPENKTVVIPIGIENSFFDKKETPGDLIPCVKPVLLNVAGMVPEKNHEGLIRIFSRIKLSFPEAQLVLIGSGRLENEIRDLVISLGLEDSVHFMGNRNDVYHFMNGSNIFLLPSLVEGLPAVILEAMASNCPVVAYDAGGISEIVRNRETGILIPVNDEEMFVNAVFEVLTDEYFRNTLVSNAYVLVKQQFDNESIAVRFADAYNVTFNQEVH
jgi:glycosyltransferase involved in cell wall biosynthesis